MHFQFGNVETHNSDADACKAGGTQRDAHSIKQSLLGLGK